MYTILIMIKTIAIIHHFKKFCKKGFNDLNCIFHYFMRHLLVMILTKCIMLYIISTFELHSKYKEYKMYNGLTKFEKISYYFLENQT